MPPREPSHTVELLQAAYRYAASLTAHPEEAEDLVHDGWLRVVERYGPDVDRPLMFRTIRNLFIDRYRHARRYPSESYDETSDRHDVDDSALPDVVEDRQLNGALSRLRDVEREALFLSVVEGYTASEIAQMTDTPRGSVLSLQHRARAKLKRWLDESDANDSDNNWPRLVVTRREGSA